MHVVNGAILDCACGFLPSSLVVLPIHRKQIEEEFAANIMDHISTVNIHPFGACATLQGRCPPATPAPWTPPGAAGLWWTEGVPRSAFAVDAPPGEAQFAAMLDASLRDP